MFNQVSTILPPLARAALAKAAAIDPDVERGLSAARSRALDSAIQRIKFQYPQFFKQEQ